MIKLERSNKPDFLSESKCLELTEKFKTTGESVWNYDQIKNPLLQSSHGKCAYCECSLSEESKYMEVEHFRFKGKYAELVVNWNNLLPACKRCNIAKGSHDIEDEPIINPYDTNPQTHFTFRLYKLKGRTELGISTIEVTDLNNSERLVLKRFEVGQQLERSIELAAERLELYLENQSPRRRNKLLGIVETILQECQPAAIYSATTATIALTDETFSKIIKSMKTNNIWQQNLEDLYSRASKSFLTLT